MQVRSKRRRRKTADEVLPPLPPVEEGHFREVKTGVLLLPADRVRLSPERRALVRRVLVTCLGNADTLFCRLWAELVENAHKHVVHARLRHAGMRWSELGPGGCWLCGCSCLQLESTIRTTLDPDEAYNDIPGEDPQYC